MLQRIVRTNLTMRKFVLIIRPAMIKLGPRAANWQTTKQYVCRPAMFVKAGLCVVTLAGLALLPIPLAVPALALEGDPNDAISCVEDLGVRGYSVRINNRCNFVLQMVTCVVQPGGQNSCNKDDMGREFPVPANAKEHEILLMQVGNDSKYFILTCKHPWTPGNPHMSGGEFVADECAW